MNEKMKCKLLQLKDGPENRFRRFSSLRILQKCGMKPEYETYYEAWEGELPEGEIRHALEELYLKSNTCGLHGNTGWSMSVGDVIVAGNEAYFTDSYGFEKLEGFLP